VNSPERQNGATDERVPAQGGFPWGDNRPTRAQRIIVCAAIATISAALHFFRAIENRGLSDFTPLWRAARLMVAGGNPYELMGPGAVVHSQYPMYYPATAFVAALPFAAIPSFHLASTAFVFTSALLLAWGVTRDGWHRLPMFPSIAYLTCASLGQWSIIMTAAIYLPVVAGIACVKPQSSIPVLASSTDRNHWIAAIAGSAALLLVSFVLLPSWPAHWLGQVGKSADFAAPVTGFAGPAVLLCLLRWRRPEAWLVLVAACLPQTWPPYNGLILMTVAFTYREMATLSLVSSFSWVILALATSPVTKAEEQQYQSMVLILSSYIPATILILRRPNEGHGPLWLRAVSRTFSRVEAKTHA
jgi:hypothetical protein